MAPPRAICNRSRPHELTWRCQTLFTLILLGESVVAVMRGMESQDSWSAPAATAAFTGMAVSFLIWWWYFDGANGAAAQPVRSRRDAVRFQIWSYAHAPLYLAIVVLSVGVQRVVTSASRATLPGGEALILTGAVSIAMLALAAIEATSAGRRDRGHVRTAQRIGLALTPAVIRLFVRFESPVALIVAIAGVCIAQLALSLAAPAPNRQAQMMSHRSMAAG